MLLTLFKRKCFFPLYKQFSETKMTSSQTIIVKECISKKSEYVFRVMLKGKSGINRF